jgi:3-phenylpropionate/trans-cinnamate dioxygenase ferredoxin reductase subunit
VSDRGARIVIVGAGHAGGTAAALLRQQGHAGPITLIGEEAAAPYQRPPLSKAFLKGESDLESLKLRPDNFYAEHGIELRLGERAIGIDRAAKRVALRGGGDVPYDVLILATGSVNRRIELAGARPEELLELRSVADAERLKAVLGPGRRLAIIGGGYIGLEAAASARALGAEAVVVELAPRVLARVASEELSAFFEARHRSGGVEILTGTQAVEALRGEDGAISGLKLADGRTIACDGVLVGVGAAACSELARDAGLECEAGVVVDETARTSDPSIWAIGDMTYRPLPLYGVRHRLESVPNALEQAKQAAAAIMGGPAPAPEVPWFWSDQYDIKLQIAGAPFGAEERLVRGDPGESRFAVFHLSGGRILCVEAVNAPAEFMAGRQLIGRGATVDRARLADPQVGMKELVR